MAFYVPQEQVTELVFGLRGFSASLRISSDRRNCSECRSREIEVILSLEVYARFLDTYLCATVFRGLYSDFDNLGLENGNWGK